MIPRRLSRRAAIIGGASSAGLVAVGAGALLLRGDDGDGEPSPTPTPRSFTPTPTLEATKFPTATPVPRGGLMRIASAARFSFDTFDAHRTGETSVAEVLARTHSRLLEWEDFGAATLRGDLAAGWQQPDDRTIILELTPNARWHDRQPLNGRPVTADDIIASLQRKLTLAREGGLPIVQRAAEWLSFERIESTAPDTIAVTLSEPDPLALATLAGEFALIQAPEAVAAFESTWQDIEPESVIGSGPWQYTGYREAALVLERFDGGHRTANLDGLRVTEPFDIVERLLAGELDEAIARDRRDAAAVREAGGFQELPRFEREPVISTFAIDGPPWNNPQLMRALSGALNRTFLADELFGGRAAASGPIPPVHGEWAGDMDGIPGYGADPTAEATEARARWEAAGGPALGAITIDFPSVFDPLYSASSVVIERLNEVLGDQFRPAVETYTLISERVAGGYYGNGRAAFWFGWSPPLPSPDPTRWFTETFRPGAQTTGLDLALFDSLLREFDLARRRRLAQDAARQVAEAGFCGLIPWLHQRSELFRRQDFGGGAVTPFWGQHQDLSRYRSAT